MNALSRRSEFIIVSAHALFFSVMQKSSVCDELFFVFKFTLTALFCILDIAEIVDTDVKSLSVKALKVKSLNVKILRVIQDICLRKKTSVHSTSF